MTVTKKPWQEPHVKSIDDLSLAYGAACSPTGSGPTNVGGRCNNGSNASNNCMNGTSPTTANCITGIGVTK